MLIQNPLILDRAAAYTFRSYDEMRFDAEDILSDLGCTFIRTALVLPQSAWDVSELRSRIERSLPYITLNSETARRETLVAPLMIELAQAVQTRLRIEYPLQINQYLKGELDYYLESANGLLVVEAKNADLTRGFVQLAVELIAASLWLAKRHPDEPSSPLMGAVTTGDIWLFGSYTPQTSIIAQDTNLYRLPAELETIAHALKGILTAARVQP